MQARLRAHALICIRGEWATGNMDRGAGPWRPIFWGVNFQPDATPPAAGYRRPRTSIRLSDAEFAIYTACEDLLLEKGYAPTLREIAERVGWKSTGSVSQYLDRLRARGVIEGRGRSLRVKA